MGDDTRHVTLPFFRVLADVSRLRIAGTVAGRECSVEELARLVELTPPTVSHHLTKLGELALVRLRRAGTTHLYSLDETALRRLSRDVLAAEKLASLADDVDAAGWERKVLRDFFEGERLKEIPAVHKPHGRQKRAVVVRWLARRFQPGVRYTEREVNAILERHHPDTATLRRELIAPAYGLMRRENGVYWRLPDSPSWKPPD